MGTSGARETGAARSTRALVAKTAVRLARRTFFWGMIWWRSKKLVRETVGLLVTTCSCAVSVVGRPRGRGSKNSMTATNFKNSSYCNQL